MQRNPIVLVHGYSDDGGVFKAWQQILERRGYDVAMVACRRHRNKVLLSFHDYAHRAQAQSRATATYGEE
jgi:ribosomal 30S subunit maturation factor RimM